MEVEQLTKMSLYAVTLMTFTLHSDKLRPDQLKTPFYFFYCVHVNIASDLSDPNQKKNQSFRVKVKSKQQWSLKGAN